MKIILACATVLVLATGCGKSYDEQIVECREALATHDFDAAPLDEGERLPECEGLEKDDYEALSLNAALDRLGWLGEDGEFDKNKMLDGMEG